MDSEPREGFIEIRGNRIHYLLWGTEGLGVVLIHSMGMDAHGFDLLSEDLQCRYRVLALDILDHGDSDSPVNSISIIEHAQIIRECYLQLGFKPNFLVGHSVGGMIGMILAAEHPDDFHGLMLVDIAPREHPRKMPPRPPPPEWFNSVDDARKYFRDRYPRFTSEAIENRVLNALARNREGRLKLKATGDAIRPSLDVNLWPYAERIGVSTLLVLGSESAVVPDESVDRLRKKINDFSVVKLEGATHMVPQDEPEEFRKLVLNFLNNK